ncbi:MAG TPA: von Willebrand factor type A domain-containing protein [Terriglobia bacterium]|nr:von Willebrand factor type A domain-containing protein [Terriglobia bacterium]
MTHINPDDPKWTAYILNELDDTERASLELELESSEEARMLVEELRLAADLTKIDLRQEVMVVPLTAQERETIRSSAEVLRSRRWGARPAVWVAGLAAAGIVLMVSLSPTILRSRIQPLGAPSAPIVQEAQRAEQSGAPVVSDQTEPKVLEKPALEAKQAAASARVFGKVQDAAKALIPGVTIVATNTQTGASSTTVTNESGVYKLEGLEPGTYRVTGSVPGFQTSSDSIQVAANAQAERDITLQLGQMAESVQVQVGGVDAEKSRKAAPVPSNVVRPYSVAPGIGTADGGAAQGLAGQIGGAQPEIRQQAGNIPRPAGAPAPPPPPAEGAPAPPPPAPRANLPFGETRAPGVPALLDRIGPGRDNRAEAYDAITDNPFLAVGQNPLSTFSIDVDTASYSNVRRFLNQNQLPPRDAVRIEEMINYFDYDYPQPSGRIPVGAAIEAAAAPWNPQHRLVRIGIRARDIAAGRRPSSNLVFLIDVSGSMQPAERLPLLKNGIRMLVEQLTANDRVTVVTYAGTTGVALRSTRGDQKDVILGLIDSLQAGGSTNGASGIQLAYEQAAASFIPGGVNRVILATDGDFNVGITDRNSLLRLIEDKAKSGVFLSVLGVGMGNYKDATLETLADKGNGNYAYIDTLNEARKVLVDQMNGTLVTVAKDVKVQVEFNPAVVDAYRLIGYENRALRNEDFNNDLKDAGDMGAGHTVTVLYEVVPRGVAIGAGVDPLKYQPSVAAPPRNASNETLTVKVRYKEPAGTESKLLSFPLVDREQAFARASADFRFAASVASFGMILRDSPFKGNATMDSVLSVGEDSLGSDGAGYRREFLQLVQRARQLRGR